MFLTRGVSHLGYLVPWGHRQGHKENWGFFFYLPCCSPHHFSWFFSFPFLESVKILSVGDSDCLHLPLSLFVAIFWGKLKVIFNAFYCQIVPGSNIYIILIINIKLLNEFIIYLKLTQIGNLYSLIIIII